MWCSSLKAPESKIDANEDLHGYLDEISSNSVAHISSIRLNEGEIYESVFKTTDSFQFIHTNVDPAVEASDLYIEDVQGKRYKVRKSRENLRTLLSAWDGNFN